MTISTLDCQPGEVKYYDSKFKSKLNESVKNQICCITQFKGKNIKIDVVPVQQQQNGFDCGFYAIASMVSLVNKEDLTSISFDEKKLWDHLYDCYKQGRLIPFPSAKENVKRNTAKSISFELFCSCRMPWAKQNARSVELQMAECDSCMEWFHRKCQRIPDQVFQRTME